jgi:ABC-2 type transport system permease protein
MRPLLATTRVEWVRFFRDRIALFSTVALPIVLVVLIGWGFGSSTASLPVGVIEQRPGELGSTLVVELEQSPALDLVEYTDRGDLYRDVRMGLLGGGLGIGPDGEPVELYVQQASTGAGVVIAAVNAAAAEVGTRVTAVAVLSGDVPDRRAQAAVDAAAQQVPDVEVVTETRGEATESEENGFANAVPSQLTLFMFLNGLLGATMLVQARQLGVFSRSLTAPHGLGVYVGGLGLSRFLIAMLQAGILLGLGVLSFGVDFGDPVAVTALVVVFGVIAAAAGMLLGALVSNPAQAAAIAVPTGIVTGMLGGCMWPLSVVPPFMQTIGHLTPQAWAMDAWNAIINDGSGIAGIATELAVLVGYAVVLSVLAVWALGRHARTGR